MFEHTFKMHLTAPMLLALCVCGTAALGQTASTSDDYVAAAEAAALAAVRDAQANLAAPDGGREQAAQKLDAKPAPDALEELRRLTDRQRAYKVMEAERQTMAACERLYGRAADEALLNPVCSAIFLDAGLPD